MRLIMWVLVGCLTSVQGWAQVEDQVDSIESELQKEDRPIQPSRPLRKSGQEQKIDYSQVKEATPYNDIAIIQKSYMPKTNRLQVNGGLVMVPNDLFFDTFGADLKLGYHFNETWGVEAEGTFLTSSKSRVTKDMLSKQGVTVKNQITAKNFMGANVYYNSIYGKTALWDRKIIPFEVYFTGGMGMVDTTVTKGAVGFKAGIGELFTIDKNRAARLELSMIFYSAKDLAGNTQSVNSMFLTFSFEQFLTRVGER